MVSDFDRSEPNKPANPNTFVRVQELEQLYDAFESAWQSPQRPALADYLARVPKTLQPNVFGHLLALELSYRRDIGERPRIDEYQSVFPSCEKIIQDVFQNRHVPTADLPSKTVPKKIWRYELVRRLGAGGQAEVFLGKHELLDREVVVKLARHICIDLSEEDRLINEGRILVQLEHPYLGRVEDLDFYKNHPFLVMRYENGRSLSKLADEVPFSPDLAARIVAQVAEAVALAHKKGVVHLDIKPGNVVLREDGSPCLIDFGLAQIILAADPKQKQGHSVVGTAAFMSPEQAAGNWMIIGRPSDVFGLGALLFWLLTGHAPFQGSTFTQCIDRARTGTIDTGWLDRIKVPRRLKAICLRAMAPNPADRFESAQDCAAALHRFLSARLSASPPQTVARAYINRLGHFLYARLLLSLLERGKSLVAAFHQSSVAAFDQFLSDYLSPPLNFVQARIAKFNHFLYSLLSPPLSFVQARLTKFNQFLYAILSPPLNAFVTVVGRFLYRYWPRRKGTKVAILTFVTLAYYFGILAAILISKP